MSDTISLKDDVVKIVDWECPKHGVQKHTIGDIIDNNFVYWPFCPECVMEKLEELGVTKLRRVPEKKEIKE